MDYMFDIVLGSKCNFRCKYCFERTSKNAYKDVVMSKEILDRSLEYAEHLKTKYLKNDDKFLYIIYGGEPFIYPDKIFYILEKLKNKSNIGISISTNGSLLDKTIQKELLKYKNLIIQFSYDYSLQKNRNTKNNIDVLGNLISLINSGIRFRTLTVFPIEELHHYGDVYFDIKRLQDKTKFYPSFYNIDFYSYSFNADTNKLNKEEMQNGIEKVKNFIAINPNMKNRILSHNSSTDVFFQANCIASNIIGSVAPNGDVYPMCNAYYRNDRIKKFIYLGNIFDEYNKIDLARENFIKSVEPYRIPNKECAECKLYCRTFPINTIINDLSEYNKLETYRCEINNKIINIMRDIL